MAIDFGPFGSYVLVTGVVDATAQAQIQTCLVALKALLPDGSDGSSPAISPEFDRIPPMDARKLRDEISAIQVTIAAAPTS